MYKLINIFDLKIKILKRYNFSCIYNEKMNKMNIKLINVVVKNFVALNGERTMSSFITSSRNFLHESFFKDSSPPERQSGMKEKDGDVIIKICDKAMRLSSRLEAVDGGFAACTEFRDLHDVAAQKARHKARRKRKKRD